METLAAPGKENLLAADERRLTPIKQDVFAYRRLSAFIGGQIIFPPNRSEPS